jgi:hypothetical protein
MPRQQFLFLFFLFLLLLHVHVTGALECHRTNGWELRADQIHCPPGSQDFCLRARAPDGRLLRDCAGANQCPQVF